MSMSKNYAIPLTDDLWIEILTRLPLKSLFRFNCVSKAWHALISDRYLRRKLPPVTSAVYYVSGADAKPRYACISNGGLQDSCLDFFPFRGSTSIIDCSNGLVLCYSSLAPAFYVCNPITRRWTALPKPPKISRLSILLFDPSLSTHFKVVCFTEWRTRGAALEVYSSESMRWAEREAHWGIETGVMSATMHYLRGTLYILAYPRHMVGIDLETMDCHLVDLPEPVQPCGHIGRNRGRLHYAAGDGDEQRIWSLESAENGKWELRHGISVGAMADRFPAEPNHMFPSSGTGLIRFTFLAFHPEADVVFLWVPGKLLSYDMGNKRIEQVCEFGSDKEMAYPMQISLFSFSLD